MKVRGVLGGYGDFESRTNVGLQAYVDMFSKSLDLEYRQFGISCHNQAPAYVATKMSKIRKPTMDAPSPANWVKAAIAHIGYEVTQCPFPCVTPLSPSFFPLRIL